MGLIYHEVLHPILGHADRGLAIGVTAATWWLWNIAADLEINPSIRDHAQMALPPGAVLPDQYRLDEGLTAEEYYRLLLKTPPQPQPKLDCGSGAHGQPRPWEQTPQARLAPKTNKVTQRKVIDGVKAELARSQGKVPGALTQLIDGAHRTATIDWRTLLARSLRRAVGKTSGLVDYTYSRPNRRQVAGEVIMPAMVKPTPNIAVVQDWSGSMCSQDIAKGIKTVAGILDALGQPAHFIGVDATVHVSRRIHDTRSIREAHGRGGTDMRVGIEAAMGLKPQPDVIVVVTDGYTPWPATPTKAKLIVVLTQQCSYSQPPSWAKAIKMEDK